MRTNLLWPSAIACLMVLTGCGESDIDKDGVPKIDLHGRAVVVKVKALTPIGSPTIYQDREKRVVTVQGKDMDLYEFINTYCPGKMATPTCSRAIHIAEIDSLGMGVRGDGKLRPLPPGL